ncbi:alpha/beta hydrolase [Rubrivirga sp.]|uniref:alpha/beta hydrolase n=1 Tax=Rubrivirga sp. TaxID=1885344 RepID=UPI003B522351
MRSVFLAALAAALLAPAVRAQNVAWTEHADSVVTASGTLHGTLALPDADGPVPVALLIAGSGPTDRDGNQGGEGPATLRKLAHALAARGVASVRFDKRGIAESEAAGDAEGAGRYDLFVADVADWTDRLQADPRFSTVSLAGHSEGGLFALAAGHARRADAVVSIAGPGIPMTAVLRRQLADPVRLPTEELRAAATRALDAIEAGEVADDLPAPLDQLFSPSTQRMLAEWAPWDPAAEAAAFDGPILVVQGTTDRQGEPDEAERLAAASDRAQLLLIDGMNHVLVQDSGTLFEQAVGSYADPARPLDETLVREVAAFLLGVAPREIGPAAPMPTGG